MRGFDLTLIFLLRFGNIKIPQSKNNMIQQPQRPKS